MKSVMNRLQTRKEQVIALVALCLILGLGVTVAALWERDPSLDDQEETTLVIGRRSDSIGLDPAVITDIESFQVTYNIYETLVKTDTNGKDILPGLAESWDISEDGLTFTFKLREGVRFHDNTQFDAHAVVFNFLRWMDQDSPYHIGQFTYWNQSFGGDPGMIRSVNALSKDTVEIVLNETYAPFLRVISMPAFGIASPESIMKYNELLKRNPVGTGPYQLASWETSGDIVLERNNSYWGDLPKISQVVFKTIGDEDYIQLLKDKDIHLMNQLSEEDIKTIRDIEEVSIHYTPFLNIGYLALNHLKEPLQDERVRKAIAMAIDKDEMMSLAYDLMSRKAYSFLPPTLPGYDESFQEVTYDTEAAEALLLEAGYDHSLNLSLWVMDQPRNYFPYPIKVGTYIQEQLEAIGIDVDLQVISWDTYIDQVKLGAYDMALVGWQGDFADPDNFLYTLFYSWQADVSGLNYAFYSNEEVDQLLRQGRRVTDAEFRANIYRNIQQILYEDMVSVPLAHTMNALGVHENVIGFEPNTSGMIDVSQLELKTE